jgi:enterochelin esterase-like enzyme/outer membrane protein assembly factor BamB
MVTTTAFLLALALPAFASDDWPHLRGPAADGVVRASGAFERGVALRVAWRAPLGPAYSGVAVAGGRVVTMMSDGEHDHVVALDAESGAERWRHALGPVYRGHDGSEDGPVSSPIVARETVFALSPRGTLVALALADGKPRWTLDLVGELGAVPPDYGFTSTPLFVDGLLVVQAGGRDERGLVALDPATGAMRWSQAGSAAGYASPVAMELAGVLQLVVLDGRRIAGVAPETGALLWEHPLGEDEAAESGFAIPLDGERFLAFPGGQLAAFRVTRSELRFTVEPLWRSRELGRSYAAPVVHGAHVYGYNSDFLTCVDAASGKRLWKSRPPGGRGLIAVDDRLIVFGAEGVVAVVRATPAGYEEEASLQALEHTSFTWPSFAGGRVYVRNSQELACVELTAPAGVVQAASRGDDAQGPGSGAFGRFVAAVEAAQGEAEKRALVDAFFASQQEFPVLEGDLVHFVYRGGVQDVAITGSMVVGRPQALTRLAGTDVFHKSFRIAPGARWEYRFQVDLARMERDPLNPRTTPATSGSEALSEVVTPGYAAEQHHVAASEGAARGRLDAFEWKSAQLENERTLQVYLPAEYERGEQRYPLLIVQEGSDWIERGQLVNTLDNTLGRGVRPLVAVFVPPIDQWWFEAGGTGTEKYLDALATELVPALAARYRLSPDAADHALLGTRNFGMSAVYGALRHPDVFGKAAVQSTTLGDVARHAIFAHLEQGPKRELAFYVDWNRYDVRDPDRGLDFGGDSRRLHAALTAAGYSVTGGEALDAYGWGGWRARSDDFLEALFPQG